MKNIHSTPIQTLFRIFLVLSSTWILSRTALYLLPGDPAEYLANETLVKISPELLRERMHLNQNWTDRIFSFPGGESLITGKPILPVLGLAIQNSFILTSITLCFFVAFTVLLLWCSEKSQRIKHGIAALTLVLASTPLFLLGPLVLLFLSIKLGLFPVTHSPYLPALTLSVYLSGFWFRTLSKKIDRYRLTSALPGAQARGLPESKAFFKYLLVPSLGSYFGFFGSQLGILFNGSILAEVIFQWNGLGALLADSVMSRDYPLVEATLLIVALVSLFCLQLGEFAERAWEEKLS